ncbi:glycosyltransferase [Treponema pedis]|uniref:Glycosyltransferase n=1 Tax=Treponema pedis TaxID=409322 RepID=A0A7S7AY04_9SPIR|nr:glycosyltransferase [Treponema pedis]QOW61726.1 glycosyltransferase [Treponema pedis]
MSLVRKDYTVYEIAPNISDEVLGGVNIYSIKMPNNKWKRLLFSRNTVYNKCIQVNADIYHFHDPELIPVGVKLKKKYNKVIVFDSHEDVPAQILSKDWLPKFLRKLISMLYAYYEKQKLKFYDALVSVTPNLTSRLCNINSHVFELSNYPLLERTITLDDRKWGNSICFAGGISEHWLHENIIKAVNNIECVKYRLAGWGSTKYLSKLRKLDGWKNVDFLGKISFNDVPLFLAQSTVAMVLNDYVPNVGYKLGSLGNNKLFEAMQAGLPVICTDFILWKEIIDEWKCGICVNPHDIEAIRNAVIYLIENKDIAQQMGDNGRRAVMEKYNWNTQEKILLEMYKGLVLKVKS